MAILVSDYPRKEYAGHFEFVEHEDGTVTARVYQDGGAPVGFDGSREEAEAFVAEAMAILKKAVQ